MYGVTSAHEHTDPFSSIPYFSEEDIRAGRAELGPREEGILLLLPTALIHCSTILRHLDNSCDVGLGPKHDEITGAMGSWWDKQTLS